jgi:hypothetical protein
MGLALTVIGTLFFITGLWGGQTHRGLPGILMAGMALVGVLISMAGLVLLFVPNFFG